MKENPNLDKIKDYFIQKLETYGANPRGADWNSAESQEIRFFQLIKVIDSSKKYSLLDYGSGFGALYDYLVRMGHNLQYTGYDIAIPMVEKGRELHQDDPDCSFTSQIDEVNSVDYAILSGTFNIKLDESNDSWTELVIEGLRQMDQRAQKGFSFNLLTKYSDIDRMRSDLYYADPLFFFDYCKRNFSKNVALLHDYKVYDFTILVRKD